MAKSRRHGFALATLFALAVGCNAILGISDDPKLAGPTSCLRNSDCPSFKVCLFTVCSDACNADRDCLNGERCLQTANGSACASQETTVCDDAEGSCPDGAECAEGVCRNPCTKNSNCLEDQICSRGYCSGTDGAHDSISGEGGSGNVSASSGGASSGGAGGQNSMGGGATVGGDLAAPGDKCDQAGEAACTDHASAERVRCEDGVYAIYEPCAEGEFCDSRSDPPGQCKKIPAACEGRSPGDAFCDGALRTVCGADLVSVEQDVCSSIQHCMLGTGANCAACLPNEYVCSDNTLQKCKPDNTGFQNEEVCDTEPCNAEAGACTSFACLMTGDLHCDGDDLEVCNDDRSAWDLDKHCGEGLCDPVDLECDICFAGVSRCSDDATSATCAGDGQDETTQPCDPGTPFCVGAGDCVECTQASDCTIPNDCWTKACDVTGSCNPIQKPEDSDCAGGHCDVNGDCLECFDPSHCGADEVCRASSCTNAIEYLGWPAVTGTTAGVVADKTYMKKIPALNYDAVLKSFGVTGTATGSTIVMALYADNPNGLGPTGAYIAQTTITLVNGAKEVDAAPIDKPLTAGSAYWIVFKFNVATNLVAGSGTVSGRQVSTTPYSDPFPTYPGVDNPGSSYSAEVNVYVKVKDSE